MRWHALQTPRIVAVSSLAKAFGAPVAVVAGSARLFAAYESWSEYTRALQPANCRGPRSSRASVGDQRDRRRYTPAYSRETGSAIPARLRSGGIGVEPGLFPIQTIETPEGWIPWYARSLAGSRSLGHRCDADPKGKGRV